MSSVTILCFTGAECFKMKEWCREVQAGVAFDTHHRFMSDEPGFAEPNKIMTTIFSSKVITRLSSLFVASVLLLLPTSVALAATQSRKLPVAFKWERFEIKLK